MNQARTGRFYAEEFEQPRTWRWIAAATVSVAILCYLSAVIGAEVRERTIKREAEEVLLRPKVATPQPEFASTTYLSCAPAEVQRAKEHIFACYRRAQSSNTKQGE